MAASDGAAPITGVTHYSIDINQFTDQVCPVSSGLGPTTFWGYHPANPLGSPCGQAQMHLGGLIVGTRGTPIQITFRNNLAGVNGGQHIIPNDQTILGANLGYSRTATHFHGGLVPWISDGGPFDWWDGTGGHGLSFLNNQVLNPSAAVNEAEYYYPLDQSARFGWYHDHGTASRASMPMRASRRRFSSAMSSRSASRMSACPSSLRTVSWDGVLEVVLPRSRSRPILVTGLEDDQDKR